MQAGLRVYIIAEINSTGQAPFHDVGGVCVCVSEIVVHFTFIFHAKLNMTNKCDR